MLSSVPESIQVAGAVGIVGVGVAFLALILRKTNQVRKAVRRRGLKAAK